MYRITYDSGAGITVWEKSLDELLVPNGPDDSLLTWMMREANARGTAFKLEYIGERS